MISAKGILARPGGELPNAILVSVLCLAAVVIGFLYWAGLTDMWHAWSREEYSHGYIIPLIAAYLFLRDLPKALEAAPAGRWAGVAMAVPAVGLGVIGTLSTSDDIVLYGFLLSVVAIAIALLGLRSALLLWAPLIYLGFMVPLPQVIYLKLTAVLQLLSTELGVFFIRLGDIPVFVEGNVIDLGVYKLQVVEACSGLRYLFPLMSFGFLFAVLYDGPRWHKAVLFLSTVPITIAMNGFRIGVIGYLVEGYGTGAAEGFLHLFEGWIIFLACIALLFAEVFLLLRAGSFRRGLRDAFDFGSRTAEVSPGAWTRRGDYRYLAVTVGLLAIGALFLGLRSEAAARLPERQPFATFPSSIGQWLGKSKRLSWEVAEVLAADDYLHAFYAKSGADDPINLFMAFYQGQTDGRAIHSPEVCIPGDGWEIRSLERVAVPLVAGRDGTLSVNRAIVQKGLSRQLVYYWFEQRGRQLTDEFEVKWWILWDGLVRNRTDGTLVRLTTPVFEDGGEAAADRRLRGFLEAVYPELPAFLPG